jgi:hypothetical protein
VAYSGRSFGVWNTAPASPMPFRCLRCGGARSLHGSGRRRAVRWADHRAKDRRVRWRREVPRACRAQGLGPASRTAAAGPRCLDDPFNPRPERGLNSFTGRAAPKRATPTKTKTAPAAIPETAGRHDSRPAKTPIARRPASALGMRSQKTNQRRNLWPVSR